MINANELRLGNLVKIRETSSYDYEVISIGYDINHELNGGYNLILASLNKSKIGIPIETRTSIGIYIKPIPLTEEWLIKFGFIKDEAEAPGIAIWDEFNIGKFIIANHGIDLLPFHFVSMDNGVIDIKYVHQLQNIYFALTGQELTIKP